MLTIYYSYDPTVQAEIRKQAEFNSTHPLPQHTLTLSKRNKNTNQMKTLFHQQQSLSSSQGSHKSVSEVERKRDNSHLSQYTETLQQASTYAARLRLEPVSTRDAATEAQVEVEARKSSGDKEEEREQIEAAWTPAPQTRSRREMTRDVEMRTSQTDMDVCTSSLTDLSISATWSEQELYWRAQANKFALYMRKSFQSAAQTRISSYSSKGYEYRHDMVQAHRKAAICALKSRNSHIIIGEDTNERICFLGVSKLYLGSLENRTGTGRDGKKGLKIDFHGLYVREALEFAQTVIEYFLKPSFLKIRDNVLHGVGNIITGYVCIVFVVGVGNNSVNNVARMGPALEKFLLEQSINCCSTVHGELEIKLKIK